MTNIKKYKSHKIVHAEPMTRGAWSVINPYQIRTLVGVNSEQALDDEGYHVIYHLGKTNEYHSWCPKLEFEEGNDEIGES